MPALLAVSVVLVCALVVVNVAYIRHLEAKDRRHDEQVGRLLQRLQAPEMAVLEHARTSVPEDGEAAPLTDEQIAEEQERTAALKRLAELEADFAGRQL